MHTHTYGAGADSLHSFALLFRRFACFKFGRRSIDVSMSNMCMYLLSMYTHTSICVCEFVCECVCICVHVY